LAEKTLSSRVVFEGRAVKLRVDTVRTAVGRRSTREIVEHADCIAVIAVDAGDNVLLVNQFRKPIEKELLEIPAGGIDPGEEPEAAVVREMREETGFRPQNLKKLGGFYSAPGYATEYLYLYLATDLVPDPLSAEDTAGIKVVPVPVTRMLAWITSGKIQDSKTIAGLLLYLEYLKTSKEKRG
jgi:ADP-ribose pyrophosphatase